MMDVSSRMQRNVVTVAAEDSLSLAVQLMGWRGIRHLPVLDGETLVGILSERDLLARTGDDPKLTVKGTVGDAMSTPVATIPPAMGLEEAAAILVRKRIDALPVVSMGQLVGILTSTDLMGHMAQCALPTPPPHEATIGDLMVSEVEGAFADDELTEAAARMHNKGIRHLPVVDGGMRVIGILSDRDVRGVMGDAMGKTEWGARRSYVNSLRVKDAMTREPRVTTPDATIESALRAFLEDRFGALPVVDDNEKLVGMVSYIDLLRFLGEERLGMAAK